MNTNPTTFLGTEEPPHQQWHEQGRIDGWPGDASYGWPTAKLLQPQPLPEAPSDFLAFWHDAYAEAEALPPSLRLDSELDVPPALATTHRLHRGSFTSTDGVRVGCFVLLPLDGQPTMNLTVGHGYGGRAYPELDEGIVAATDAVILPVTRGLPELSITPGIPSEAWGHVLHGIESPSTYVLRGCIQDLWRASAELDHLVGTRPRTYQGVSFGGGTGALALLGGNYARAALHVPTFGNHPLRVTLPCVGSGGAVASYVQEHPEALDVLAYFDAATAASHVTTPTMVGAALWDPAVPPPGQFAVYHALAGPKELVVTGCGHTDYPGAQEEESRRTSMFNSWLHALR